MATSFFQQGNIFCGLEFLGLDKHELGCSVHKFVALGNSFFGSAQCSKTEFSKALEVDARAVVNFSPRARDFVETRKPAPTPARAETGHARSFVEFGPAAAGIRVFRRVELLVAFCDACFF